MAKATRGRGEGSVYERKDGKWEGRVSLGVVNGKRVRRSVYGATKAEALRALSRAQLEAGQGYPDADRLTLTEYLHRWLDDVVDRTTRYKTAKSYRETVENHIIPHVGHVPLSKVSPLTMDGLIAALETATMPTPDGKSTRSVGTATQRYACVVFRIAIRSAARKEVIPRNPFADVRLKTIKSVARPTWTMEDAQRFFATAAVEAPRLWAFFVLAVALGLRHSEILGLKFSDFDFEANTVEIKRRIDERHARDADGKRIWGRIDYVEAEVKTANSEAIIPVPMDAMAAIQKQRALRAVETLAKPKNPRSDYVFVTKTGTIYAQGNVRHTYKLLVAKAGLKTIRIHDLRHTCATVLLQSGCTIEEIAVLLRHSDPALTQRTYAHVTEKMQHAVAHRMDALGATARASNAEADAKAAKEST